MNAKNIKKEYTNGEITVVWESGLCKHAGACVLNNPDVFKPKEKPWIQMENSSSEAIVKAVKLCPSGALKVMEQTVK